METIKDYILRISTGVTLITNIVIDSGCLDVDTKPLSENKNNQRVISQPVTPSCNPVDFVRIRNYPTPVPIGGDTYIKPNILTIRDRENNCQDITDQQIAQILAFNKDHPAIGMFIRNETDGQLNIDPTVLALMERNIKESGLDVVVNSVKIRDLNDPVFKASGIVENYGTTISTNGIGISALIKMDFDPDKEIYLLNIYLANSPTSQETALHEVGHTPDWIKYMRQYPNQLSDRLKQIDFSNPEFENNYHQRFKKYMQSAPSGELAPFTNPYEKVIVMGKSIELGRIIRPASLDGSEETSGRSAMYLYYYDPEKLKKEYPDKFDLIEKEVLETERLCRSELWAEIWALRVLDREKALKLYPEMVLAQEGLIELLKDHN